MTGPGFVQPPPPDQRLFRLPVLQARAVILDQEADAGGIGGGDGGEAGFTHDLPQWNLRWGAELDAVSHGTDYRIDEVTSTHNPSRLEVFAEYKPSTAWTVRIYGMNLQYNFGL